MKSYSCRRILPSICVLIILLFSLSSCSSSSQAAISSAVEEASGIPTSSFLFSDATWDTTSDELVEINYGKLLSIIKDILKPKSLMQSLLN